MSVVVRFVFLFFVCSVCVLYPVLFFVYSSVFCPRGFYVCMLASAFEYFFLVVTVVSAFQVSACVFVCFVFCFCLCLYVGVGVVWCVWFLSCYCCVFCSVLSLSDSTFLCTFRLLILRLMFYFCCPPLCVLCLLFFIV